MSATFNINYAKSTSTQYFLSKEKAERKMEELNSAASILGFVGLGAWITEIEAVE